MIYVCDAIMGTGKSTAAITYMNEHANQKFIYITPYLDEVSRIQEMCPKLNFVQPTNKLGVYDHQKVVHTQHLILEGKNIATTHASFKSYTQEMLDVIKEQKYTLIIDENVDVLELCDSHPDDIQLALDAGYIKEHNNTYTIVKTDYDGRALGEMYYMLKSRELIRSNNDKSGELYYWTLPPDLIMAFKDVYILTYLFSGQSLHHFMEIYNLEYKFIGIERDDSGAFRFGAFPGYTPEYVSHLNEMVDIYEGDMNEVGSNFHALSLSWFEKDSNKENVESLKNNLYNYFRWKQGDTKAAKRMWATFKSQQNALKGKGYANSFIPFNYKATNEYRDRVVCAYPINIFMNVNEKKFYNMHGIAVDEGEYALSIMVQWIWRSAIRDGEQIHIYIPSRRMRELLQNWIERTMKGGNTVE